MEIKEIKLPFRIKKPILAMGSQTKNTVCFAKNNLAYLSPVHPDLSNPEDFLKFEKDVKHFLKRNPQLIAYDSHPEYQSTKYIHNLQSKTRNLKPIQHHHAHIASCMVENRMRGQKVIGVAFDGTGLGSENKLWGAEFLVCDYKGFQRKAHLREIPLLGGERAILEPSRLTLAWLYKIYKDRFLNFHINFVKGIDKKKWRVLKNMYLSGVNSPLASSMGRLFDAVASLVLAKYQADSEAGLAGELEKLAAHYRLHVTGYPFKILQNKDKYLLEPTPMFKQIILDLKAKEAKEKIAYRFHLTVAGMIKKTCLALRAQTRINKVVLSGGVFQNNLLLSLSSGLLYKEDFKVFIHQRLSCNDSGISLGQVAIANFLDLKMRHKLN